MRFSRRLVSRLAFAIVAAYVVMTVAFALVSLTADPNAAFLEYSLSISGASKADITQALAEYRAARGLDQPLPTRYLRWLVDVTTFDWGTSFAYDRPVTGLIAERLVPTLSYVVPAVVVSALVGGPLGVASALRGRVADGTTALTGYLLSGVPNFWLATVLLVMVVPALPGVLPADLLATRLFPALVLALGLTVGQFRYARNEAHEWLGTDLVKLVRAKGGDDRAVGRHLLRLAALPLLALFITDTLAVLVLNVYVLEAVFPVQGFGALAYRAVFDRDLPVIIGTTMTVAFLGIAANVAQDLLTATFDPRSE